MGRLDDKVAIVTGAGSGIGLAIAEGFRQHGARVYATDISAPHTSPDTNRLTHLDVSKAESWTELLDAVATLETRVDILVNNAGIASPEGLADFSEQDWQRVIAVNMYGPALGMSLVLPLMSEHGGSIINVSSIYALRAARDEAAYHASKSALLGMTRNAAATYAELGVRVNALLPGLIMTPMTVDQGDSINFTLVARTPLGRAGTPQDLVGPAVFLASEESDFVTGVSLPVDGGYLAV